MQKLAALDRLRTATEEEGAKIKSGMPSQASLCSRRVEALNAARGAIGRETFERFLYVVIAPDVRTSIKSYEGAEGAKRYTMWIESGCR
ncbi:MAG TPA: hypothetical protein VHL59_17335 [Thermoanaerobaculia bacterium]|nr:hypothetical protein [Thermoanaerobaculia bacterium]